MQFDNSISLGTIVGIVATLFISMAGAVGVYFLFVIRQDKNLTLLTFQVGQLATEISALKDIVKIQTEQNMRTALLEQDKINQNERIARLERVIEEMQHGEHFVLPISGRNKTAFGEG